MLNENKPKTFWQRPEGIPGAAVLIGIIGASLYGLNAILPFLITLTQNTLHLFGLLGVLGIISYAVLDPHVRATVWLKYKAILRSMTGWVINLDPIGIMKAYIQTLRDKREVMDQHLILLNGELKKVEREIGTNKTTIDSKLREATSAQKQLASESDETAQLRLKGSMNLSTREASRLDESNKKLSPLLAQMQMLYKMINKLYINSEFLIQDMDSEVKAKEREYNAIKEASKAVNAAKSIFGSGGADLDIFNQSVEALQEDIGNRVGAITRFMDNSQSVLTSIDVKNGMMEESGLRMLEEFNDKNFSAIFSGELGKRSEPEKVLIVSNTSQSQTQQSKFNNLLD